MNDFAASQVAMKKATETMLEVSRAAPDPEARKRYDAAHKAMTRIMREWNKIEHTREGHGPTEGRP